MVPQQFQENQASPFLQHAHVGATTGYANAAVHAITYCRRKSTARNASGMMPPFPGMPMPPMPNGLMQPPGAFPSPQQFPPPQNMFGMYGMMPPPFSPPFPGMNMNIDRRSFQELPVKDRRRSQTLVRIVVLQH